MKTCKACKTQMGDSFSVCPICKMKQENAEPQAALYPNTKKKTRLLFWRKLISLLLWMGVLASAIVNISVGGPPWAVYVFLGVFAAQVAILSLETAEISLIRRIIYGSFAVCLLLWGIEYFTKSGTWATEFVIPLVLFAAMFVSVTLYFSAFGRYRTQFLPMLTLAGGSLIAAGFGVFGKIPMRWPLITLSGFAFAASMAMLITFRRTLRAEFKKKMHR